MKIDIVRLIKSVYLATDTSQNIGMYESWVRTGPLECLIKK